MAIWSPLLNFLVPFRLPPPDWSRLQLIRAPTSLPMFSRLCLLKAILSTIHEERRRANNTHIGFFCNPRYNNGIGNTVHARRWVKIKKVYNLQQNCLSMTKPKPCHCFQMQKKIKNGRIKNIAQILDFKNVFFNFFPQPNQPICLQSRKEHC